jgi:hypothetical protein
VGGDESLRGADVTRLISEATENPLLQEQKTQENRREMESSLNAIFQRLPVPRCPVIIMACSICGEFHYYDAYERGYFCPQKEPLPCDQIRISREWPLKRRSELEFAI